MADSAKSHSEVAGVDFTAASPSDTSITDGQHIIPSRSSRHSDGSASILPDSSAKRFTLFARFPPELRQSIWTMAYEGCGASVSDLWQILRACTEANHATKPNLTRLHLIDEDDYRYFPAVLKHFHPSKTIILLSPSVPPGMKSGFTAERLMFTAKAISALPKSSTVETRLSLGVDTTLCSVLTFLDYKRAGSPKPGEEHYDSRSEAISIANHGTVDFLREEEVTRFREEELGRRLGDLV